MEYKNIEGITLIVDVDGNLKLNNSAYNKTKYVFTDKDVYKKNVNVPQLYNEKAECCGCSACAMICPGGAIRMETDREGFLEPVVYIDMCIGCHKCLRVCPLKSRVN